ncbi:MAG: alpha/beta hydrolase [Bacteroidota bacterium]
MYAKIKDLSYYYQDRGKTGETVLLLHGNPDSSDMWEQLLQRIEPTYRCIALDLPGFGRSEIDKKVNFSLEEGAKWMQDFFESLDIKDSVHLILHDVGAFYGLPWAIRNPDNIKSLCVTNTLFFSDYSWHFWGRIWRTPIIGELAILFADKNLYKREMKKGGTGLSEEFLENGYKQMSFRMRKTVLKMYRAMSPSVFRVWEEDYLKLVEKIPIQVIWGELDPYIPMKFGYAERFAQKGKLLLVPEAGHWIAAEKPDIFAKTWQEFAQNS